MTEAEKFWLFVRQGPAQVAQVAPVLIRIEDQAIVVTARCMVEGVQLSDDEKLKPSARTPAQSDRRP
jgi:hypothetical protein